MKVKCKEVTGVNLLPNTIKLGYSIEADFELKINDTYIVYGMSLWGGSLQYLIQVNDYNPSWFPAELFTVEKHKIPENWSFDFPLINNVNAIWGYKELVDGSNHYDDLLEREGEALRIFEKRKKEQLKFLE
ncbi:MULTISPECIES: hypothetical protein [unclassified Exiguobacterium]|uniref:hypothetical protein n=1 Tax=unclassified Exiguobacterium TaxID=2644629 RepID=UPI0008CCD603|nr:MULTISPECIES: hypothetical protein [unclassified Exiguobacterium]OGX79262.1 hypothetical protein A6395_07635 [Exiguobacterium sp. SH31]TCI24812.1 phosphoribosylaminoimidazole synthetase [Exiguobacterium sp. SH5S4]TCI49756.1 phosphoribosylaminoimidazole synthetase [Exiguobacterium sp. SH5S13]TCI59107.1 phosphoribosylaminoimidazole synthetase [Exiguobacterium sp. SH0S2]